MPKPYISKRILFVCLLLFSGSSKVCYPQGFNLVDRMFVQDPVEEVYIITKSVLADTDRIITASTTIVELEDGVNLAYKSLLTSYLR